MKSIDKAIRALDEEKHIYKITEVDGKHVDNYHLKMTEKELKAYLKQKRDSNGYVKGVGGNKKYDIFAAQLDY